MELITDNFVPALCARISTSSSTIVLCFYSASAPLKQHTKAFKQLWSTLLEANSRGCKIRLLFDHHLTSSAFSQHVTKQILSFRELPFKVRFITNKKKVHSKFAVFDSEWFYIGSHNLTPSGTSINFETGITARDVPISRSLLKLFEFHWEEAHEC